MVRESKEQIKANPLPKQACNPLFCKSASHATLFHFDQPSIRTSPKYIKSHSFHQDTAGTAQAPQGSTSALGQGWMRPRGPPAAPSPEAASPQEVGSRVGSQRPSCASRLPHSSQHLL